MFREPSQLVFHQSKLPPIAILPVNHVDLECAVADGWPQSAVRDLS